MNYKIVFLSLIFCHYMYGMEQNVAPEVNLFVEMASHIAYPGAGNINALENLLKSDEARRLIPEMRAQLLSFAREQLEHKQLTHARCNYAFNQQLPPLHSNMRPEERIRLIQQANPLLRALCQQSWEAVQGGLNVYNWFLAYNCFENLRFPQAIFNPSPRAPEPRLTLDNHLNALITNERQWIYACVFHFTLYNVAKKLVEARERGVDVQLITNCKQADKNPALFTLNHLVSNDILVKLNKSRNAFETNHHKFIIFGSNLFNSALVWVGSYNVTGYSNKNSWEDVTVLNDPHVIAQYLNRFNEMRHETVPLTLDALKLQQATSNPSEFSLQNNNVPQGYFDNEGVFKEGSRQ